MSLTVLRSFVEVCRCRSITAAARNLGLTQPAVSGHIATLETQVGRELFTRRSRGVSPTAFAEDLAAQVGDNLDRAEEALAQAKARSASLTGVVHVAGPAELLAERVAPSLRSLQASGLDIRLHPGGKSSIYQRLTAGEVDLAFTASDPGHPLLASQVIGSEKLLAVAAPGIADRINDAKDLLAALQAEPMLAYDNDLPLIRDWLQANGISADGIVPAISAPDLRLLRALAETGSGWSVIPDYLCSDALQSGRITLLHGVADTPVNHFYLAWTRSSLRHPRVAFARELLLCSLED